jgi:hypothetical protein
MSRLEWILGILLVVLLGAVIVLSLLFWFQPDPPTVAGASGSAAILATRANVIAPTSTFAGQTARVAFAPAQNVASEWREDAVLLNASATWPQGADQQQLLAGETTWGFTFYSAASQSIAAISVVDGQASLISQGENEGQLLPVNSEGWRLDSREAIEQFLSEQGREFMAASGVTTLTMMLTTGNESGRIEWLVSMFANQTGASLTMLIDATSGDILDIQLI